MFKTLAIFLLLFSQAHTSVFDWFSSLSPRARQAKARLDDLDTMVEKALQDYNVPGIAVGVIVDGQLIFSKGYGYRDLEKKLPVTKDTLFAIGSCTKAFTSFLMGTLVDERLLEWDDLVIDVLPEFRLWDQYATQNLNLRDLLTHRTGMPRHDIMWYNSSMDRAEVMRRLRYLEPSCGIRQRYQYNNLSYLTAGYVMEQVTGKKWEELIKERILKPLKMNRTNFCVQETQAQTDFATPYIEKNGQLKKMSYRNVSVAAPAAGINSSVADLALWVAMHLKGGSSEDRPLISPATLQEMHAPQVVITGAPETEETLFSSYGLGWNISSYRGHYCVSHDGGPEGFTTVVGFLPHSGVGIIILANKNLTKLSRFLSFQIVDRVLELSYKDWLKSGLEGVERLQGTVEDSLPIQDRTHKKGTSPSHSLENYVGDYSHPGYGTISIDLCDGKLQATFNSITLFLDHWHYDVFTIAQESEDLIISLEGMKFTFRTNVYGEIDELATPFEANVCDIVFKKVHPESFLDLSYLRQFVGFYEIYGYTVEIAVRNQGLCAIIPGQPLYELIPTAENEFAIKSLTGYNVRFHFDDGNRIEEVLLKQPYGAIVAKPKNQRLGE